MSDNSKEVVFNGYKITHERPDSSPKEELTIELDKGYKVEIDIWDNGEVAVYFSDDDGWIDKLNGTVE